MRRSASSLVVLWPVSRQIDILREPGAISVGQRQVRSSTAIGPIRLEGWLHRPATTCRRTGRWASASRSWA